MNTTLNITSIKNDLIPQGNGRTHASYDSNGNGIIAKAMRRVRDHHGMAYNKLLSLRWEASTSTAYGATDGRRLILNPNGINKLCKTSNPVGYMAFLLVHEALHALLNHGTRLSKFTNHEQANIAADYVINAMIKRANIAALLQGETRPPFPMIAGCLIDEDLSLDKEVEQLYGELMQNLDTNEPEPEPEANPSPDGDDTEEGDEPSPSGGGGDSGGEQGDEPDDQDSESGTGAGSDSGEDADGESDSSQSGPAGDSGDSGSGRPQTDDEILGDDFVGSINGEDTFEPELEQGETPRDAAEDIDRENERIAMNDEINDTAGFGGSSGRLDITNQQNRGELDTPWEDIIRDWMTYSTHAGWVSPFNQQVYQATGMVSAGRGGKAISNLAFVVDTSGSMCGSSLRDIMAKIQVVLDELQPRSTAIIPCDHLVRTVHDIELGGFVPETLEGGGGTCFQPALDYVERNYPTADGIVFLTDGYASDLHLIEEPNLPILWLTYGLSEDRYPFGDAIKVRLFD